MRAQPRILLIGSRGQVGWELSNLLTPIYDLTALDTPEIDLGDSKLIERWVSDIQPQFIVNAAAYTDVEKAEDEPACAMSINGEAPGLLANAAKRCGATLIHYSTDYVFGNNSNSGEENTPLQGYKEEMQTNPLNVYGKSKRAGEEAIEAICGSYFIFRTSWVYGLRGKNFLLSILKAAQRKETLKVVSDQIGAPTWSRLLAQMTLHVIQMCAEEKTITPPSGLYNLTGQGKTSWHGFAQEIVEKAKEHCQLKVKEILPVDTSAYATKAVRPRYSLLNCRAFEKTFEIKLPDWQESLQTAMVEFKPSMLEEH